MFSSRRYLRPEFLQEDKDITQLVYNHLAGYEDTNDAVRLARVPLCRQPSPTS